MIQGKKKKHPRVDTGCIGMASGPEKVVLLSKGADTSGEQYLVITQQQSFVQVWEPYF